MFTNAAHLLFLAWFCLGTYICIHLLSARRIIRFSTELHERGLLKPEFKAFARRDGNDLPSLPMLILRAYTVAVARGAAGLLSILAAGIFAITLPRKWLPTAIAFASKCILLSTGVIVSERGERANVKAAPCLVANHNSALDILILLTKGCYFVSMDGVRNIPIAGYVADAIGCIFVARDSKESRLIAKEKIAARLRDQMSGSSAVKSQLVVFPEGSTNNGYAILQFRRGAFEANVPIQPVWIEFSNYAVNFTVLSLVELGCITCALPAREVTLHWCPVINPNGSRSPEETAELARREIYNLESAYGHPKVELMDESVSHRDAIACAKFMRGLKMIHPKSE
jgi:1-acyl-sn-glycerol-3-phosphate acyltransferase